MAVPKSKQFELAGLHWQCDPITDPRTQFEIECILIKVLAPPVAAGSASLVQGLAPALVEVLREAALGGGERITEFDTEAEAAGALHSTLVDRGHDSSEPQHAIVHPNGKVLAEDNSLVQMEKDHRELVRGRVQQRGGRWLIVTTGSEEKFDLKNIVNIDTADPRLRTAWDQLLEALAETAGDVLREVFFTISRILRYEDVVRLFELAVLSEKTMAWDPTGNLFSREPMDIQDMRVLGGLLRGDPQAKWELLGQAVTTTYGRPKDEDEDEGDKGDA